MRLLSDVGKSKRSCLSNGDRILNGRYEVLKCIHSKGMANVYIIQDRNLGKQWCLKEIRKSEAGKKDIEYISLLQEANILRSLSNERIPRITTIDDEGDSLFVVMDFLDGITLKAFVEEKGRIPEDMAVKWMLQITQTMGYLHSHKGNKKPIFYRDMKPDNLMIRPNGTINIFDFGISIRVEKEGQLPDYTLGTPGYVAPEQKKKDLPVDLRSDIYSMGMTFYYMLTGVDPRGFLNEDLKPINDWSPDVSPALVTIVNKCIESNPDDRFQDCEELQYELENYKSFDSKYRSTGRKKINIVGICLILGLLLCGGSLVPFNMQKVQDKDEYDNAVLVAKQSGRLEDYNSAIALDPSNLTPYEGYLEVLKEDGVFSLEDESMLLNNVNPNLAALKENEDYGKIAFEIGKLYWFYYPDSDNGKLVAVKWFQDSIEKGYNVDEATIYYNLGVFKRDISKSIMEANDFGMYKDYWNNLIAIQSKNTSDIVTLQTNISIVECISSYAYNLKKDGISYEDIKKELDILDSFVSNYSVDESTLDVVVSLYNDLKNSLDGLAPRIKTIYGVQ